LDAKLPVTWSQALQLSQTHYAEEVLRTFGFWENLPRVKPMKPNTRLSKDDCDPSPKPDFHKRDRGIVGSLAYLVTMTRPDLARSYSELGKYVQFPGKSHMEASEDVLRYLRATWNETITYTLASLEQGPFSFALFPFLMLCRQKSGDVLKLTRKKSGNRILDEVKRKCDLETNWMRPAPTRIIE